MGPRAPSSTTLSKRDEAIAVFLRRHTLLPLDDCLYVLQALIPASRSSLYRCFRRHGINRLPEARSYRRWRKASKARPIGCLRLAIAEIRSREGGLCFFFAIDLISKFTFGRMYEGANRHTAIAFLREVREVLPYRIHTVVTNSAKPFETRFRARSASRSSSPNFDTFCARYGIQHRVTRPDYPWSREQVTRMNRAYDAGAKVPYHQTRRQAEDSMLRYHRTYNFGKRLKALKGLTPYESICKVWEQNRKLFWTNPYRHFASDALLVMSGA